MKKFSIIVLAILLVSCNNLSSDDVDNRDENKYMTEYNVCLGYMYSGIVKDGNIYIWGMDLDEKFSYLRFNNLRESEDTKFSSKPVEIYNGNDVRYINGEFEKPFYFIKNDNTLWIVGKDEDRIFNNKSEYQKPTQIYKDVKAVIHSDQALLILKTDNTLWAKNSEEEFKILDDVQKIYRGKGYDFALKNDYSLYGFGEFNKYNYNISIDSYTKPVKIDDDVKEISFSFANDNTCLMILKNNGNLYIENIDDINNLSSMKREVVKSNVIKIASTENLMFSNTFYYIDDKNILWGKGSNEHNELKIKGKKNYDEFIKISDHVVDVYGGTFRCIFIKSDNTFWTLGLNKFGYLGVGDNENKKLPAQIIFSDAEKAKLKEEKLSE